MTDEKRDLKKGVAKRARRIYLLFVFVVLVFAVQLARVQLSPMVGSHLEDVLEAWVIKPTVVKAQRGTIYSRDGKILATSIVRKSVLIDFGSEALDNEERFNQDVDTLSVVLAKYLGEKSAREYKAEFKEWHKKAVKYTLRSDTIWHKQWWKFWEREPRWKFWEKQLKEVKRVKYIKKGDRKHINRRVFRDVDQNEWEELRKLPILNKRNAYDITDKHYRVYPQGDIALRTIGRNDDETGRKYGIENALNDTLAGRDGLQYMQDVDPRAQRVRIFHSGNIDVQDGYDVVTTLDVDVQDVADRALRDQLTAQKAFWGTTVVMECATGDILAIANLGRNNEGELYERQNYAIGTPVHPGSTFKLISSMALLDNGFSPSTKYATGLGKRVPVGEKSGAKIGDSHPISKETGGVIDMRTAFAESSNVYFTKAAYDTFEHNPQIFSDFCRKLHLHEPAGLEYLGARAGTVPHLDKRHPSRYNALVNMAFGYNIAITPLHTLTVYNAVANGGKMVAPRLILRIEKDGKCVKEVEPRVIEEQICTPKTVSTLRSFMEDVSRVGTAKKYFGEKACSFTSGSKTGTAQINMSNIGMGSSANGRYYYGSMVTYLPADNPRYTIITAICSKDYGNEGYYGASLAGPVQQKVATFLHNRDKEYAQQVTGERQYAKDIKGGSIEAMREVAGEYADRYSSSERKGWGVSDADGSKVVISSVEVAEDRVPNVVGMGLSDALYLLESRGLSVEIVGAGRVVRQSISAGTPIEKGQRVKIELK